jgi:hypothetical protein
MTRALRLLSSLLLVLGAVNSASAQPSAPATDVVRQFYDAFQKSDFGTMESLYGAKVAWHDTVFSADGRDAVMGIWRFELDPKVGGQITYQILGAKAPDAQGNTQVQVRWRDVYKFFGNPIDHSIDATLTVDAAGKIVSHQESYSWSEWAHQAFPFLGSLVDNRFVEGTLKWLLRRGVSVIVAIDDMKRGDSKTEEAKRDGPRPETPGMEKLLGRVAEATDRAGEAERK